MSVVTFFITLWVFGRVADILNRPELPIHPTLLKETKPNPTSPYEDGLEQE